MPIFDYKCNKCGTVTERLANYWNDVLLCSDIACTGDAIKMPSVPNMHLFPKDGIHLKHVCPGGKIFHSKNEMKQYAIENNVELGALL